MSQSGETYDVLAAVQELKRKGARVLGVVNVVGSAIAREADGGMYVHAGPEVCVVSTRFTNTTVAFALLALHLGPPVTCRSATASGSSRACAGCPRRSPRSWSRRTRSKKLAEEYAEARSMLFIGRVRGYPVAREASLKLKEVSYIHAEAYPASELKHGPLALIEPALPTVAIVPDDDLLEKNRAALEEIKARSGRILAVAHQEQEKADQTIVVPKNEDELDPILMGIPLQLLAYHTALALGCDIDKPRNLAKSVTVEKNPPAPRSDDRGTPAARNHLRESGAGLGAKDENGSLRHATSAQVPVPSGGRGRPCPGPRRRQPVAVTPRPAARSGQCGGPVSHGRRGPVPGERAARDGEPAADLPQTSAVAELPDGQQEKGDEEQRVRSSGEKGRAARAGGQARQRRARTGAGRDRSRWRQIARRPRRPR